MKTKIKVIAIIIFILLAIIPFPTVRAPYQSQTIQVNQASDDGFVLSTGVLFNSDLLQLQDPMLVTYTFMAFRDVDINFWEPLNNASLFVRGGGTLTFDPDAYVIIRGILPLGATYPTGVPANIGPDDVLNLPRTTAYVRWNISDVYGPNWFNVSITPIIEEIKNDARWDGDGNIFGGVGDDIMLVIFSAPNVLRFVHAYDSDPNRAPYITINWDLAPSPPVGVGEVEYNSTYRGITIWRETDDWFNYTMYNQSRSDVGNEIVYIGYDKYNTTNIRDEDALRLQYNWTEPVPVNASGWITRKFGIDLEDFQNVNPAEAGYITLIWCIHNHDTNITRFYNGTDDVGEGGVFMSIETDTASNNVRFEFRSGEEKGVGIQYATGGDVSPWYGQAGAPYRVYIKIQFNPTTWAHRTTYYSDPEMTTITHSDADTFVEVAGWGVIDFSTAYLENVLLGSGDPQNPHDGDWVRIEHFRFNEDRAFIPTFPNGTAIPICPGPFDTIEECQACIDTFLGGPDPFEPDPPGQDFPQTGGFTRFRMRLYFLAIGLSCLTGPMLFFAWKRPSGYYVACGLIIMLIGLGLIISIGQI